MSDPVLPAPDLEPLPDAPANSAYLGVIACSDGAHVRLRLNYDVTGLHADRQKLLLHLVGRAVKEIGKAVEGMDYFTVQKALREMPQGGIRSGPPDT